MLPFGKKTGAMRRETRQMCGFAPVNGKICAKCADSQGKTHPEARISRNSCHIGAFFTTESRKTRIRCISRHGNAPQRGTRRRMTGGASRNARPDARTSRDIEIAGTRPTTVETLGESCPIEPRNAQGGFRGKRRFQAGVGLNEGISLRAPLPQKSCPHWTPDRRAKKKGSRGSPSRNCCEYGC